jgi:hypothetical protein
LRFDNGVLEDLVPFDDWASVLERARVEKNMSRS